jgi:hypothetical protein
MMPEPIPSTAAIPMSAVPVPADLSVLPERGPAVSAMGSMPERRDVVDSGADPCVKHELEE